MEFENSGVRINYSSFFTTLMQDHQSTKLPPNFALLETLQSTKDDIIIVRAENEKQKEKKLIKFIGSDFTSPNKITLFKKDFQIGKKLCDCEHIANYISLDVFETKFFTILQDDEYLFLESIIEKVEESNWKIICNQVIDAIGEVHKRGIIHGAISPKNILVKGTSSAITKIKLLNFTHSSSLSKEFHNSIDNPLQLEQDLRYISPEQTGRMNRDVDYRTDFYSLGILLYQLTCRKLPFDSIDPMEIIYSHIASIPPEPFKVANIPKALSDIIMELLKKNVDERYQSLFGLKRDLEIAFQLRDNKPNESFVLKQVDIGSKFKVSQTLYGREKEISRILSSFENIRCGIIPCSLLSVCGYSGIGKTSLISELKKPLTTSRGNFISGKFDQFKKNIPYVPFIQAFKKLVSIILSLSSEKVVTWKERLLDGLDGKGQIIIDLIPELELIIGKQNPVPDLEPTESQNRFNHVFLCFLKVFCNREHPLIIFIDDLQWADLPTLHLIELIVKNPEIYFLYFIICYRNNEVNENHPLLSTIKSIRASNSPIEEIELNPLVQKDVDNIVAATLSTSIERCSYLSSIIFKKTGGNPLYVTTFLTELWQQEAIYFSIHDGRWEWNLIKIQSIENEDVVQVVMDRILRLPPETQGVLGLAACVGNQFHLKLLSVLYGKSKTNTARDLWPALNGSIIIQFGQEYKWEEREYDENDNDGHYLSFKFIHDRVQQAAYELQDRLNGELSKERVHLNIGRLSLERLSIIEQEEQLFDILSHFKIAQHLIQDYSEKIVVAQLALKASMRARRSSAYGVAINLLRFSIELLKESSWESDYSLVFSLHKLLVECEYLERNYSKAEELYKLLISKARTTLDKVAVYFIQTNQYEVQQRFDEAIEVMLHSLRIIGIQFPDTNEQLDKMTEETIDQIKTQVKEKKISDIIYAKEIRDETQKVIVKNLIALCTPCYSIGKQSLYGLVSTKLGLFSLQNGICEYSSVAFIFLALTLVMKEEYDLAHEFEKISLSLGKKFNDPVMICRTYCIYAVGTNTFRQHLSTSNSYLEDGFNLSLETGDFAYAANYCNYLVSDRFFQGVELLEVQSSSKKYLNFIQQNRFMSGFCTSVIRSVKYLLGEQDQLDYEKLKRDFSSNPVFMAGFNFGHMELSFWMLDKQNWIHYMSEFLRLGPVYLGGTYKIIEGFFISGMIILMNDFESNSYQYQKELSKILSTLEILSKKCESNVQHKYLLLIALQEAKKQSLEAVRYFSQAIESARKYSFVQFEALGNELLLEFWMQFNQPNYAHIHLKEALTLYKHWGAKTKVNYLRQKYSHLLPSAEFTSEVRQSGLDSLTISKVSQALSTEVDISLDQFLQSIMKIIIENAGAQRGLFFLADDRLLLVAEAEFAKIEIHVVNAIPIDEYPNCPSTLLNYVNRTKETVLISDCAANEQFSQDPYLISHRIKSVLCMPIIKRRSFKGIIYLENSVLHGAFTEGNKHLISILSTQIAFSLENDRYMALLESEKRSRMLAGELNAYKQQLEEFVDVLCHELRNPLNGIFGNQEVISVILKKCKSDGITKLDSISLEQIQEAVDAIQASSEHLKDIVDTVLTRSMIENHKITLAKIPFDPLDVIKSVATMIKARVLEKGLELVIEKPNDQQNYNVIGDPYRLRQIILNLVTNSLKFTDKGSITISIQFSKPSEGKILTRCSVKDTGIGMSEREQSRLFKKFSQANKNTQSTYGGSGLGLVIVKDLLQLMGGTIDVMSNKGFGSEFVINVILDESKEVIKPKTTEDSQKIPIVALPSTKNILIVEDAVINQRLLKNILESSGYKTSTANNGLESLKEINRQKFDVVLMDIEMPVMGGLEATRRIRQSEAEHGTEAVPIIGVSANAQSSFSTIAFNTGMNDYITKPYQRKEILEVVAKILTSKNVVK